MLTIRVETATGGVFTIYNATAYGEAVIGSTTPTGEVRMFHFAEGDTLTQV